MKILLSGSTRDLIIRTNPESRCQTKCATQIDANLDHLVAKLLFHRQFDNMPLPRKLINKNILINGSQVNNRQTAPILRLRRTRPQFPYSAE